MVIYITLYLYYIYNNQFSWVHSSNNPNTFKVITPHENFGNYFGKIPINIKD